jgi:hypothetical protein
MPQTSQVSLLNFTFYYFIFTIVMKVLENPNFFIEVLDELELFINKKVIFDEQKNFRLSKFCNPHNFFSFQPRHLSFAG